MRGFRGLVGNMKKTEKKMTEKQLYKAKVKWFVENGYEEIKPRDFYREIFPENSFQKVGEYNRKSGNGILIYTDEKGKHKHRYIFDDLKEIEQWYGKEDVYVRGASFIGKKAKNENASMIYALTFDLDGQGLDELHMIMQFMRNGTNIPMATHVVLSGHGLHLYYVLETPLRANMEVIRKLNKLKEGMTKLIWNRYTSTIEKPQYQYCLQGFRMVGSASKMGKRYPVRAYRLHDDRYTIEELVDWIPKLKEWDEYRINLFERSTVPLDKAKMMWPDWYKYRIEQGLEPKWHIKRDLYDWWLRKLREGGGTVGHRYFCVMCLAIYAIKCDISEKELRKDAYELIPILDELSKDNDPDSRFTKKDVDAALAGYRQAFKTWGRDKIALVSAIPIEANKRNYRTQAEHIKVMTAIRDIVKPNWRNKNGRPKGSGTKAKIIQQWRKANPEGRKIDCIRETGISKPTVLKWWDHQPDYHKSQVLAVIESEIAVAVNKEYKEFLNIASQAIESYSGNISLEKASKITDTYLQELFGLQERMIVILPGGDRRDAAYHSFWSTYVKNEL